MHIPTKIIGLDKGFMAEGVVSVSRPPPPSFSAPLSPVTRWRFYFLYKWRKSKALRGSPVVPSGAAETAWRGVFAARRPAISALVSVAEVRSPLVYEVFMPGAFSAYKRISFCVAHACRGRSLAILRLTPDHEFYRSRRTACIVSYNWATTARDGF